MSQIHGTPFLASFKAAATLSAFRIVGPGTAVNQVALWATATSIMIGVTQEASEGGTNTAVSVALGGCAKLTAGASVSTGSVVTGQTATGLGIESTLNTIALASQTAGTVPFAIGVALDSADTNSTFELLIQPRLVRITGVS